MPSQREIARHWGVSQPVVNKAVKNGCPTNSLKAADRWREARGQKRERTDKTANLQRNGKGPGRPQKPKKPAKTGDSLLDALNNAIVVADGAFVDYEHARVNNSPSRSARLSEHNKALDQRFKAEKAYREEMERRNILVEERVIMDKARRIIDAILSRVKKLPVEQGPQCNPLDPLLATKILQKAVDAIMKSGAQAING